MHGAAREAIPRLAARARREAVHANRDYEPAAHDRATPTWRSHCRRDGIAFHLTRTRSIFERDEILTQTGTPYSVFTPYRKAWLARADARPTSHLA